METCHNFDYLTVVFFLMKRRKKELRSTKILGMVFCFIMASFYTYKKMRQSSLWKKK